MPDERVRQFLLDAVRRQQVRPLTQEPTTRFPAPSQRELEAAIARARQQGQPQPRPIGAPSPPDESAARNAELEAMVDFAQLGIAGNRLLLGEAPAPNPRKAERARQAAEEQAALDDLIAQVPQPFQESARRALDRPTLPETALGAAEVYQRAIIEPLAALVSAPASEEIRRKFDLNVGRGMNPFQALTEAYRDTDLPPGVKGAIEIAADALLPIVGFGGDIARIGGRTIRATRERGGPPVRSFLASERGSLGRTSDAERFIQETLPRAGASQEQVLPVAEAITRASGKSDVGVAELAEAVQYVKGGGIRRSLREAEEFARERPDDASAQAVVGRIRQVEAELGQVPGARSAAAQGPEATPSTSSGQATAGQARAPQAPAAAPPARSTGLGQAPPPAPPRRPSRQAPPPGEPPGGGPPEPLMGPEPSPLAQNIIGLRSIEPGLTRREVVANTIRETMAPATRAVTGEGPVLDDPFVQSALRERARVRPAIESQANRVGTVNSVRLRRAFEFDEQGRIPSLAGVDETVPAAPTLQDVAARLPAYQRALTPQQLDALRRLETDLAPYRQLLEETGVRLGSRADIIDGGFYVPRGRTTLEGVEEAPKVRGRSGSGGGRRGFEHEATFASQAEGIEAGFVYPPLSEVLSSYARGAGTRATDAHVGTFLRGAVDPETGQRLAQAFEDGAPVRGTHQIDLPGLQGVSFPDELANAANRIIRNQGELFGRGAPVLRTANAVNNLYRGMRATLDNSGPAIQGLLGLANDQRAWTDALRVNLRSWADDSVLGTYIEQFDDLAAAGGRLSSSDWARAGIRIGGSETEFQLGQGLTARLGKVPGIKQANRAFGNFGDALRLGWADDLLRTEIERGRALNDIVASGDLERVARVSNNMTGWAEGKAFSSAGDLLFFAPRFLQSRLETLAQAAISLRPGASLNQRIARKSMMRAVGSGTLLTVGLNEVLGNETDFRPVVDGRWNSDFMRVRAFGRDWSLFGTWDSLARAIVMTAQGDFEGVARGLGSGLVQIGWDTLSGSDFIGERVPSPKDEPVEWGIWLMQQFLPFAAEGVAESASQAIEGARAGDVGETASAAAGTAAEFLGIKASPLSLTDVRDIVAGEQYGKRYDQLLQGQQGLVDQDARVQEHRAESDEAREERGEARRAGIESEQVTTFRFDRRTEAMEALEADLRRQIDAGLFGPELAGAISGFKQDRYAVNNALLGDLPDPENKSEHIADILAEAYWSTSLEFDENGLPNWGKWEADRDRVLAQARVYRVPEAYIVGGEPDSYRSTRFDDSVVREAVEQYEADVRLLGPFFEMGEDFGTRFSNVTPEEAEVWAAFLAADTQTKRALREQHGDLIRAFEREQRALRDDYLFAHPRAELAALRWGFRTAPISTTGQAFLNLHRPEVAPTAMAGGDPLAQIDTALEAVGGQ